MKCFLDLVQVLARSPQDQALEIVLLRQQVRIAQHTSSPAPRLSRREKVTLAALGARYRDLATAVLLVPPETMLQWHRELVRRQWTYRRRRAGG